MRTAALLINQLPHHRLTTGRSGNNTAAQRGACDARRLEQRPLTHESTGCGVKRPGFPNSPALFPVSRLLGLVGLDAADVVWRALHQRAHQVVGLFL